MGANPKKSSRGNKSKGNTAREPDPDGAPTPDPMALVLRAEEVFAVGDLTQAQDLMAQALALAPKDPAVLTAFGSMLAEAGNPEKAILTLRKAVSLQPDAGFEKFMYLGQLLGETDAAEEVINVGISILKADISDLEAHDYMADAAPLRSQLCSALCSLAELRLHRCASVAEVEADCEDLLRQASEADASSPEPLQALAGLRHEQGRTDEAYETLQQSMAKWWKPAPDDPDDAHPESEGIGAAGTGPKVSGGVEADPDVEMRDAETAGTSSHARQSDPAGTSSALPSYEFRFECAKLLIEVDTTTDTAIQVLEELLAEYDDAPDTWHLLSLAYYGGGMYEEAAETLEYGYKLLQKLDVPKDSEVAFMYDELKERIAEAVQLQHS